MFRSMTLFAAKFSLAFFILLVVQYFVPVNAADSYNISFNTTVTINEQGVCRKVFNGNPTGAGVFVSTKTLAEYTSFLNNLPPSVKVCSCTAQIVGAICWYYGGNNETCTNRCATFGGYDNATETYAGRTGTNANCRAVLDALAAPGAAVADDNGGLSAGSSLGCHYDGNKAEERVRGVRNNSTAGGSGNNRFRACACNS